MIGLSAAELLDMQALVASAFDATATVYTPDPATGAFTVVARAGLACRLALPGAAPDAARAESLARRRLLFDPAYGMPARAQVEVGGARWNVEAPADGPPATLGGVALAGAADIARTT
jgi:hypothetical protein